MLWLINVCVVDFIKRSEFLRISKYTLWTARRVKVTLVSFSVSFSIIYWEFLVLYIKLFKIHSIHDKMLEILFGFAIHSMFLCLSESFYFPWGLDSAGVLAIYSASYLLCICVLCLSLLVHYYSWFWVANGASQVIITPCRHDSFNLLF